MPENSKGTGKKIHTILIVDDRFDNRYLLQALLEGNGYQVISAENGQEALDKLASGPIDAIISDILMPVMDGFRFCREVRKIQEYSHIPFIFYTASYLETKDRNFGLSLGADEYITKPVEPDDFLAKIHTVFSRFIIPEKTPENETLSNQLSFYASYSDIIEKKLTKKLIELDEQKELIQLSEGKYQHFFTIFQGIGYLYQVGELKPISFEGPVEEMTGYTVSDFLNGNQYWSSLLHPDDKERYLIERKKAENHPGDVFSLQYRIIHKNGEVRWVQETASVFPGKEQEMVMFQGAIYDKTDQVLIEEKTRISEEHYRFLFETMAEGVVYQDKNGHIIDVNQSAERILGIQRAELLGRVSRDSSWKSIREDFTEFPGEEHPSMVSLRTGQKQSATMGIYNPTDKQYHWIFINSVPIFQPGEKSPDQVFTTFEDITNEQLAKNALKSSEKQYRDLVESITDTVFTLNKAGEFVFVSPTLTKNFGYEPSDILGHHYQEFIHPDDLVKVGIWFQLSLQNTCNPVEFRGFNADKQMRYYRLMASPVLDGDVITGISGLISDITVLIENDNIKTAHTREIQGLLSLHLLKPESEDRIFTFAVDTALFITDSKAGFIASVNQQDNSLHVHIWSSEEKKSREIDQDLYYDSHAKILDECIQSKKPLVMNECSGDPGFTVFPPGDLAIRRCLFIPIQEDDKIVAILAVANKEEPYSESNVNALKTLGNTLWDIISRKKADNEIKRALYQIARNMEQLATLNDTIRNPLAVIALLSDEIAPVLQKDLMNAVMNINDVVTSLDQGWIQSEKVRKFLMKHYHFTEAEFDEDLPSIS